ncbi:carnosine N-methyltransferase isoform X1 [Lepeophtheirus salmonis]|nr:carnosine N-methyltransferase-like isoform X1 [Lepeophtheirus salmonis]
MNTKTSENYNYGAQRAYQSMHEYHNNTKKVVAMRINSMEKLSYGHKSQLSKVGYVSHLKNIEKLSETNQMFLQNVLDLDSRESHFQRQNNGSSSSEGHHYMKDYKRIQNLFHSLYLEWSVGGKPHRDQIFNKIKEKLKGLNLSNNPKILVPGAALCRLPYNLSIEFPTYEIIACESSLINVLVSNYILNYCDETKTYSIYPWITDFINNSNTESILKASFIPDVSEKASFELVGGDFGNVSHAHRIRNSMDVIITQFFIDSATNILDVASCVQLALKNEGYWINLGPLNYGCGTLLELSFDILKDIIIDIGFEMVEDSDTIISNVAHNPESMMKAEFKSVIFVCKCVKNKV